MTPCFTAWPKPSLPTAFRLPHLLLMALLWLSLPGCQYLGEVPDGWDPDDSPKASSHARRQPGTSPGLFKRFTRSFMTDGSECWASWWTAPRLQPDVWARLQRHYQLKVVKNDRVNTELSWYVNNQAYLNRVSARASRYLYHVANELEKRNLPGELALLPIVESAYNPYAYSTSSASGLWQFIPGTAKHLGMNMNWWYDDRRDIVHATNNALNYLTFLRDHYDGDWLKALAAYNAGWGTIDRAVAKNKSRGLPTDYWNLDVPDETKAYVPKMLALTQLSRHPKDYGIYWDYIPDLPYFAAVTSTRQMDIQLAADSLSIDANELYLLNPGLSRWATPPGKPFSILVPIDQANDLQEYIANGGRMMGSTSNRDHANPLFKEMENKVALRPSASRASGKQTGGGSYKVKRGDTWWSVAKTVGISSSELQRLNGMSSPEPLKLGQTLVVPGKGKSTDAQASKKGVKDTISPTGKSKNSKQKNAKRGNSKGSHRVGAGDTLMSISRAYGVDVDDLAKWNGINKNKYTLKIGQPVKLQP